MHRPGDVHANKKMHGWKIFPRFSCRQIGWDAAAVHRGVCACPPMHGNRPFLVPRYGIMALRLAVLWGLAPDATAVHQSGFSQSAGIPE